MVAVVLGSLARPGAVVLPRSFVLFPTERLLLARFDRSSAAPGAVENFRCSLPPLALVFRRLHIVGSAR
eukprot:768265-Hanusia_phi.AAC.3